MHKEVLSLFYKVEGLVFKRKNENRKSYMCSGVIFDFYLEMHRR